MYDIQDLATTRQTLVEELSNNITKSEDDLICEALSLHTGKAYGYYMDLSDRLLIISRMRQEVYGGVKHFFLDDKEIIEIHPLTFEYDETTIKTNFKYRIYPK